MDDIDATLLEEVQRDAERSSRDLAESFDLTPGAVHKRLKRLKEQGYIRKTCALLDREKLGLDLLCFLFVRFRSNMRPDNMAKLQKALDTLPAVLESYTTTGDTDAIIKVVVRDHNALKELLRELAQAQEVIERVHTSICLEELKSSTELPVAHSRAAAG
jgi:Lrp/AsnC family leucine-responsive transcriptional regulator/Lrp/AsnC family transcriptional regulator